MLAALEAGAEARRQLVADASHELRTPLATLLMNVELLAEDAGLVGEERERLHVDAS
jgi:two-component system sensor histidine kinase MprB